MQKLVRSMGAAAPPAPWIRHLAFRTIWFSGKCFGTPNRWRRRHYASWNGQSALTYRVSRATVKWILIRHPHPCAWLAENWWRIDDGCRNAIHIGGDVAARGLQGRVIPTWLLWLMAEKLPIFCDIPFAFVPAVVCRFHPVGLRFLEQVSNKTYH